MSNPQITGRPRPGPTEALRAVFSGIGRIFMAADKGQRAPASQAAAQQPRWRSLDETGNVRLLTPEDLGDGNPEVRPEPPPIPAPPDVAASSPDVAASPPDVAASPPGAAASAPGAAASPPGAAASPPDAENLPLASYDTLSLASIRARLRKLDVAQLRTLVDYEATHAERADVLGMLERRIEKLESGG
jgi:hypothetical protein